MARPSGNGVYNGITTGLHNITFVPLFRCIIYRSIDFLFILLVSLTRTHLQRPLLFKYTQLMQFYSEVYEGRRARQILISPRVIRLFVGR